VNADHKHAPRGWIGLEVIAVLKFIQALGMILAGLSALGLLNPHRSGAAQEWLEQLALREGHEISAALAARTLQLLEHATPKQLMVAAVGSFIYAAVFLVEGVGLWRCKRWAEYLTIGVTASLLPFEFFAVAHHATPLRIGAVVINLAVVIYLVWQLTVSKGVATETAETTEQH
jgi:uncharacterized membrane protein (DUF2068 family)